MKRKWMMTLLIISLVSGSITGCGAAPKQETEAGTETGTEEKKEEGETAATPEEDAAAKEAEANDCYEKGRAAFYGLGGTEINYETAYENFEKAEELGKVEANFYLGLLCGWHYYPEMDFEAAKDYYEACDDEDPYAKIALGLLYYNGQGVEKDKEKAKEMFQTVVDQGCADGYLGLADAEQEEKNYKEALEYYNKVVEEGTEQAYIADAMNSIGGLYYDGEGVKKDYEKAFEWYEKSADLGNPDSMLLLGSLYYAGKGVEKDYEKGLEWYEMSANLGNPYAIFMLGTLYYIGEGVEQDHAEALKWYEKSAELGDTNAMNYIGAIYCTGKGVEQDFEKALEWFEKSAELGNKEGEEYAKSLRKKMK